MSMLEKAIVAVVEVFEEYAGTDEKKSQLSNAELAHLITNQLTGPEFKNKLDPENIKEAMEELDKNRDGEVNFREFSQCVAGLARCYYKQKHEAEKRRGRCRGGPEK